MDKKIFVSDTAGSKTGLQKYYGCGISVQFLNLDFKSWSLGDCWTNFVQTNLKYVALENSGKYLYKENNQISQLHVFFCSEESNHWMKSLGVVKDEFKYSNNSSIFSSVQLSRISTELLHFWQKRLFKANVTHCKFQSFKKCPKEAIFHLTSTLLTYDGI